MFSQKSRMTRLRANKVPSDDVLTSEDVSFCNFSNSTAFAVCMVVMNGFDNRLLIGKLFLVLSGSFLKSLTSLPLLSSSCSISIILPGLRVESTLSFIQFTNQVGLGE